MENPEWVMPTHIVTAAGIVLNEKHEILDRKSTRLNSSHAT